MILYHFIRLPMVVRRLDKWNFVYTHNRILHAGGKDQSGLFSCEA
jgi:hypothetical protein